MQFQRIGISAGDIKSDYLYFDKMIPIFLPDDFTGVWPARLTRNTQTQDSPYVADGIRIHPEIYCRLGRKRKEKLTSQLSSNNSILELQKILAPAIQALSKDIKSIKSYEPVPILNEEVNYGATIEDFSSFSVISQNVIDIDVKDASWKQLKEFKKDKNARRSLVKYRSFWQSNCVGKTCAEVEDDICVKLDDLMYMIKKHGFSTLNVTSKAVIKDSSVYSSALAAFAGVVLSGTATAKEVLVPGVILSITGILMSVVKSHKDKEQFLRDSDVLYLKMLEKSFRKVD